MKNGYKEHHSPYLSIVVTSRNDNHGGDLLGRMQLFLTSLLMQCQRYKVQAELIIVEWNPPEESLPLSKALDFGKKNSFCPVRIITVPSYLHQQLKCSEHLPLFQMIAKNIGIRRARGEFVLATNIDVIFSGKLMAFFSSKPLLTKRIYRIDRTDVDKTITNIFDLNAVEKNCKRNIVRIYCREGILIPAKVTPHLSVIFLSPYGLKSHRFFKRTYSKIKPWLPSERHWRASLRIESYNRKNCLIVTRHLYRAFNHFREDLSKTGKQQTAIDLVRKTKFPQRQSRQKPGNGRPALHTNACGDFTLLSKEDWLNLGGNPEWEMFSFHLDSVFMYLADANKIKEIVIPPPARLYHIEHESGYTPEQGKQMYARMRALGIPILTTAELKGHRDRIYQSGKIHPENSPHWGFSNVQFEETLIA